MKTNLTSEELMLIAGSRQIKNGETVLAGTGQPLVSVALAKIVHAPRITVFVAATMNPRISGLPLGASDIDLFRKCSTIVGYRELYELLQAGRIDTGIVGAAQIDKYGNVNTTLVGSKGKTKTRLSGSGGGNDIASLAKKTILMIPLERRRFVEKLDYLTSPGYFCDSDVRRRIGLRGNGPSKVITTKGVLGFDPETKEMRLEAIYPGFDIAEIQNDVGFKLLVPKQVSEMERPTREEERILKKLLK
jgi:glutaconate CoA-transferase subunit B